MSSSAPSQSSRVAALNAYDAVAAVPTTVLLTLASLISLFPAIWARPDRLFLLLLALAVLAVWRTLFRFQWETLKKVLTSPIVILATVFLICALSTYFLGPPAVMQKRFWALFYFFYLPIFVCALVAGEPRRFLPMFYATIPVSIYYCIVNVNLAISAGFTGISPIVQETELHKNVVGELCAYSGLISVAYLASQRPKWWQILLLAPVIVLSCAACLAVDARACMLSIPITAFTLVAAQIKKRRGSWKLLFVLTICFGALFAAALKFAPQEKIENLQRTEKGSSFSARPYFWQLSWEYIEKHPFQPVGFGNVARTDTTEVENACNFFLEEWIQVGIVGAVAYSGLLFYALWTNFKICVRPTRSRELAMVAASCLAIQILRFIRDVQDTTHVGNPLSLNFFMVVGVTLFMQIGIEQHERAAASKYLENTSADD